MDPIVEKPRFVWWLAAVVQLPAQLFITIWCGGFFGGLSRHLFDLAGASPRNGFGTIAFLAIPCVTILGKRLSYGKTEYSFFDDHVEVAEGFFVRQMKTVAYRDFREVTLRRGPLQRLCGLGSIYLGTLATGSGSQFSPFSALGFDSVTASGVNVRDLAEPDRSYAVVRRLVDEAKKQPSRDGVLS